MDHKIMFVVLTCGLLLMSNAMAYSANIFVVYKDAGSSTNRASHADVYDSNYQYLGTTDSQGNLYAQNLKGGYQMFHAAVTVGNRHYYGDQGWTVPGTQIYIVCRPR